MDDRWTVVLLFLLQLHIQCVVEERSSREADMEREQEAQWDKERQSTEKDSRLQREQRENEKSK